MSIPDEFYEYWRECSFRPESSFGVWNEKAGENPFYITRDHWLLLIAVKGKVTVKLFDDACSLKAGDMVILSPSRRGYSQLNHHTHTKVIRFGIEWIPSVDSKRFPLELLPAMTPVPHPDMDRLLECSNQLVTMTGRKIDTLSKMNGRVMLTELLTCCVTEGFRLGLYSAPVTNTDWIIKVVNEINRRYRNPDLNIHQLSETAGRSVRSLQQAFQKVHGEPVLTYIHRVRILHAVRLLESNPDIKITHLMERVGYRNRSFFNRMFKRFANCTPSTNRPKNHN